jgi:hypothetical protein
VKRLTERQVAVLAAVERMGNPTIPELRRQFPSLTASAILSVIVALQQKGKVVTQGEARWVYAGDAPQLGIKPEQVFRVTATGS